MEIIQSVGWNVGNKRAEPIYRRDPLDGTYLIGADGDPILKSDFEEALDDLRSSSAVADFPWMVSGHSVHGSDAGWSVPIADVLAEPTLCLDPKRHSRKVANLRQSVVSRDYFRLGDILEVIPEKYVPGDEPFSIDREKQYQYVQIEDIGVGDYGWTEFRGWELPDRAKHYAEEGDIFVGAIWSSVSKWFLAAGDCRNVVVTNGCHRLRLLPGKDDYLVDLVAGLCSEAYRTQMRALARGSDGLAEVAEADITSIVLPRITDESARSELEPFVKQLQAGHTTVKAKVGEMIDAQALPLPQGSGELVNEPVSVVGRLC